jgi:hypothetical protein
MSVSCECCVLSGTRLCNELITCLEESHQGRNLTEEAYAHSIVKILKKMLLQIVTHTPFMPT